MTHSARANLLANLDTQRRGCAAAGSPFYARLLERVMDDVRAGGAAWKVLEPYASAPFEPVYPLRLLGGIHRMVLGGEADALARHYPSVGGDGDADAAWAHIRALLDDPPPAITDAFSRAVQTNEVGRSVALVGGLLWLANRAALPIRLLEVGASAGLNLRVDRYWYEQAGAGWGSTGSPLRFVDRFAGGSPPFGAQLEIVERRGCDRDPLDADTHDGRLDLLCYVWPGMTERFDALQSALEVARAMPVTVDRADAAGWVESQLASVVEGTLTVVWHSIVWQYLDEGTRARVTSALEAAGARATAHAPIAWLRLEPRQAAYGAPELRVRTWPSGDESRLATAGFHLQPVTWGT